MSEDIEDYEDQIDECRERIENNLEDFDETNAVDKLNKINSIKQSIENMAENVKFYKIAVQRLSMSHSNSELMGKYKKYMDEIENYRQVLKQKRADLKNEGGLEEFDDILEDSVTLEDNVENVRQVGVNIQEKSKKKLEKIMNRVADAHKIADINLEELDRQKEQILKIQDSTQKLDSTLKRTQKYLKYFGKSFCRDPVTLTMMILIVLVLAGVIVVQFLPKKEKDKSTFDQLW